MTRASGGSSGRGADAGNASESAERCPSGHKNRSLSVLLRSISGHYDLNLAGKDADLHTRATPYLALEAQGGSASFSDALLPRGEEPPRGIHEEGAWPTQ
jgi:hypothetical protein